MNRKGLTFAALALILLAGGCKPTEKNYKAAYDVAQGKREREAAERKSLEKDLQIVGNTGELEDVYGIRLEPLGGDTVRVLHHDFMNPGAYHPYLLLVAKMKMPANANAMAGRIKDGMVVSWDDDFYVVAGKAHTDTDIIRMMREFREKNPDWRAINLPDLTVAEQK